MVRRSEKIVFSWELVKLFFNPLITLILTLFYFQVENDVCLLSS